MANIIVCGYMIRHPVAGNLFAFLHYVLGLQRLGHNIFYLEESGWANSCYDPLSGLYSDGPEPGLRAIDLLFETYRLHDVRRAYVANDSRRIWGACWKEVESCIRTADLILNVGGVNWLEDFLEAKRLALIDMDPLFTQCGRFGFNYVANHSRHFSYGTRIGQSHCVVPTLGQEWTPLLPPVVPEIWRTVSGPTNPRQSRAFTTIATWHSQNCSVEFRGENYGQKDEEFQRYESVPTKTNASLELATSGMPEAIQSRFIDSGWRLANARDISSSIESYCAYIQSSAGEFSVAKNAYVKSRSGWFSDRSVCYLASGLPVIVQETGISEYIDTGQGILTFRNVDEACYCLEKVMSDPEKHNAEALRTVARYFDYRVVLSNMLQIALS